MCFTWLCCSKVLPLRGEQQATGHKVSAKAQLLKWREIQAKAILYRSVA